MVNCARKTYEGDSRARNALRLSIFRGANSIIRVEIGESGDAFTPEQFPGRYACEESCKSWLVRRIWLSGGR